jgi:hypothetical protein
LHTVPALPDHPAIVRRDISASATGLAQTCDAIYLGRLDLANSRRITASVREKAVVTIAEADPDCRSEAMFCFVFRPRALSFRLNIDAISRSAVRIDPRVLRISDGS